MSTAIASAMCTAVKEKYKATLQKGVCEVVFKKANGEEREMVCSLHPSVLPPMPEENPDKPVTARPPEPDEVITVWDMDAKGWRRFIIPNVIQAPILIEEL